VRSVKVVIVKFTYLAWGTICQLFPESGPVHKDSSYPRPSFFVAEFHRMVPSAQQNEALA